MSKKNIILIIVIVAIVVIAAGFSVYFMSTPATNLPSPAVTITPAPATTPEVLAPAAKPTQPTQTLSIKVLSENLSYSAAINEYSNSRIQLNQDCQGSPSSMVIKNGNPVMIDNRANAGKWFTIGGTRFYFNAYAFKIFVIKSAKLPKAVVIDCGSTKNSVILNLN